MPDAAIRPCCWRNHRSRHLPGHRGPQRRLRPHSVTPRFRINRANEPGFVRPAEKFIAPQAPVLNLLAFGQVLGSLTDYNLASADEDDLSVLRSIAPSHHRYIVVQRRTGTR